MKMAWDSMININNSAKLPVQTYAQCWLRETASAQTSHKLFGMWLVRRVKSSVGYPENPPRHWLVGYNDMKSPLKLCRRPCTWRMDPHWPWASGTLTTRQDKTVQTLILVVKSGLRQKLIHRNLRTLLLQRYYYRTLVLATTGHSCATLAHISSTVSDSIIECNYGFESDGESNRGEGDDGWPAQSSSSRNIERSQSCFAISSFSLTIQPPVYHTSRVSWRCAKSGETSRNGTPYLVKRQ